MKRVEIRHITRYDFGAPVQLGPHRLLLRPREGHDLRIAASVLDITPEPALTWHRDFYDNTVAIAEFGGDPATQLVIESRVGVELYETMPLDFVVDARALVFPVDYDADERAALAPYMAPLHADDAAMADWLAPYRATPRDTETFAVLDRLNRQINADFDYQVREEPGVLAPAQTLAQRNGSCRDLAALFLESCRRLGIAARFVSGYVYAPATETGGGATHAWVEVYLPGAGWKGFDPTNLSVVGPDHIRVAVHRDPQAVSPVTGSFTGPRDLGPGLLVDVAIQPQGSDT